VLSTHDQLDISSLGLVDGMFWGLDTTAPADIYVPAAVKTALEALTDDAGGPMFGGVDYGSDENAQEALDRIRADVRACYIGVMAVGGDDGTQFAFQNHARIIARQGRIYIRLPGKPGRVASETMAYADKVKAELKVRNALWAVANSLTGQRKIAPGRGWTGMPTTAVQGKGSLKTTEPYDYSIIGFRFAVQELDTSF
jgi:hypothetical protein